MLRKRTWKFDIVDIQGVLANRVLPSPLCPDVSETGPTPHIPVHIIIITTVQQQRHYPVDTISGSEEEAIALLEHLRDHGRHASRVRLHHQDDDSW